jgi:outer membrane murein-binding lipoprotein Lpp
VRRCAQSHTPPRLSVAAMNPDEAKAVIAELMLAGAVSGETGAQLGALFDELNGWRDKQERDREAARLRMQKARSRTFANVREQAPSRARSSSSYLEEGKNVDDGDTRARDSENINLEVARAPIDPSDLIAQIEGVVKEHHRWPPRPTEGWNRAVDTSLVERLLREGVTPNLVLDAVRGACARSTYEFINGFNFFSSAIARAHRQARAQLSLPLNNSNNFRTFEGGHGGRRTSVEEQLRARRDAARRAEAGNGEPSVGAGSSTDLAMAAVENE